MSQTGDEIKRLLDVNNLSMTKICMNNPIEYNSFRGWLSGKNLPSNNKIEVLAPALGTSIANLRKFVAMDRLERANSQDNKDGLVKKPEPETNDDYSNNKIQEETEKEPAPEKEVTPEASAIIKPIEKPTKAAIVIDASTKRGDLETCAEILRNDSKKQMQKALQAKSHLDFTLMASLAWAENTAAELITGEIKRA